jgi:hypothetical protein
MTTTAPLLLSESERAVAVAGLRFAAHVLRQRGGNWQRFHHLADQLEQRPSADINLMPGCHTEHVSTSQAADRLGVSARHARRLAARLGGHQLANGMWLIPADSFEEERPCDF